MTQLLAAPRGVSVSLVWFAALALAMLAQAAEESIPNTSDKPAAAPVAVAAPPADATKYDLRFKLKTGDVLRFEVSHRASIRSTIDETTQAAQTKTDSVKLWKVSDVMPNGDIEFMNVVERVHMVNQLPDRDPIEYNSEVDTTPPPGFEDAAKAIGVPLSSIRITPRGKVVRREVMLGHLAADDDAPIVVRLPDEPVAVGATWDEPFDVKVEVQSGGTKSIHTRRHFKLSKVDAGIATIDVTYQVLSPIDPTEEAQLVQRMMTGTAQFNIETGRLVGQQMEIDKKILGFAGPTSSLQYLMRMEEKAVDAPPKKVAAKPAKQPSTPIPDTATSNPPAKAPNKSSSSAAPTKKPPAKTATQPRPSRSASRTRSTPQGSRGYKR